MPQKHYVSPNRRYLVRAKRNVHGLWIAEIAVRRSKIAILFGSVLKWRIEPTALEFRHEVEAIDDAMENPLLKFDKPPYVDRPNTPDEIAENIRFKSFYDKHPEFGNATHFACGHRRTNIDCDVCEAERQRVDAQNERQQLLGCLPIFIATAIAIALVLLGR